MYVLKEKLNYFVYFEVDGLFMDVLFFFYFFIGFVKVFLCLFGNYFLYVVMVFIMC